MARRKVGPRVWPPCFGAPGRFHKTRPELKTMPAHTPMPWHGLSKHQPPSKKQPSLQFCAQYPAQIAPASLHTPLYPFSHHTTLSVAGPRFHRGSHVVCGHMVEHNIECVKKLHAAPGCGFCAGSARRVDTTLRTTQCCSDSGVQPSQQT